jgi:hypothetical protein
MVLFSGTTDEPELDNIAILPGSCSEDHRTLDFGGYSGNSSGFSEKPLREAMALRVPNSSSCWAPTVSRD